MDELSPAPAQPGSHPGSGPARVGDVLHAARERLGLSLTEVGTRTRVPLRHLEAIEANDFASLPSPTYATGFAKAYARTVGADEVEVARQVREELARSPRIAPEYRPLEEIDPARVPSRGVAAIALGLALALAVLLGLYFGTGLFRGGGSTPAPTPTATTTAPVATPAAAPTPVTGQVTVAATDEVWIRIYDRDNKTLHQGTMQAGDRFEVSADAVDPMINVGRPDKISITVNGSQIQGLNLGANPVKDVRISAAALAARAAGTPEPAASPATGAGSSTPAPRPRVDATAPRRTERAAPSNRPAATTDRSETERANRAAAAASAPPPGNAQ